MFANSHALFHPRLTLTHLGPQDRQLAHAYCDELGLLHESRGEGSQRALHITRPAAPGAGDDADADAADAESGAVPEPQRAATVGAG
jgi:hypothetical protein